MPPVYPENITNNILFSIISKTCYGSNTKNTVVMDVSNIKLLYNSFVENIDDSFGIFLWDTEIEFIELVKFMLSQGADIDYLDNITLVYASYYGYVDAVKFLLSEGATINAKKFDESFHHICAHGHLQMIKLLVENGADIHTKDSSGNYVVQYAAENKDINVLKYLFSEGADIHVYDDWLFRHAYNSENTEMMDFLISKGVDKAKALSVYRDIEF